jgi:transposase, IS5 family
MRVMEKTNFGFDPLLNNTRKEIFLDEMNVVVPWPELVALITPHARGAHQVLGGRPPFPVEVMLSIHCLQLWWNLSDPAMEGEMHERPLLQQFAGLVGARRIPDETTILRFRHLLEKHELAPKSVVQAANDLVQATCLDQIPQMPVYGRTERRQIRTAIDTAGTHCLRDPR